MTRIYKYVGLDTRGYILYLKKMQDGNYYFKDINNIHHSEEWTPISWSGKRYNSLRKFKKDFRGFVRVWRYYL